MLKRIIEQSHVDYIIEVILAVFARRDAIGGFRFTHLYDFGA